MRGASVVVDTNVFLAARNPKEPEHDAARDLLDAIDNRQFLALVSVISLAELRAGFTAAHLPALWTPFLSHLLSSDAVAVEPVDGAIAIAAGALRNERGLSLPDAIICATAVERSAICVVTNDRELLGEKPPIVAKRPGDLVR